MTRRFSIATFHGGGIGDEIVPPCLELLALACELGGGGVALDCTRLPAGTQAGMQADTQALLPGDGALPHASLEAVRASDAILLGTAGDPGARDPDGGATSLRQRLCAALDLHVGRHPIRSIPGVPGPLADRRGAALDLMLVHPSTAGPGAALDTLFGSAARLTLSRARDRARAVDPANATRGGPRSDVAMSEDAYMAAPPRLTRIDEVGALARPGTSDAVDGSDGSDPFRTVFRRVSGEFELRADHAGADTMAMHLVAHPWEYDVLVAGHRSGRLLSGLGTALVGGTGYAHSADIGERHALFRPRHGSAPAIAGKGLANPTALLLCAAMMLDWLGDTHRCQPARTAGERLRRAVDEAFRSGELVTCERGGKAGTAAVIAAVRAALTGVG